MTLTPPTGLAAEKEPNEEAEDVTVDGVDEASDDITVDAATLAASEEADGAEESSVAASSAEASEITAEDVTRDERPPASQASSSDEAAKTAGETDSTRVTSVPGFPKPDDDTGEPSVEEEVTLARSGGDEPPRPSVTEDEEEETKVETEETAIHAAAIRGDLESGLSAQASVHRDKALRKNSDLEFAEPDADLDDEVVSAGPVLDENDDGIEVGAHLAPKQRRMEDYSEDDSSMFGHSPGPSALVAALSARRPATPPTGTPVLRTDGFGSARLPTPVPGFVSLPIIGANLPAPASSPFGKMGSVPTPYGSGRSTSVSGPALQIPAPSGAAATASDGGGLFRKIPIPVGGLAAAGLSCVVAGVIVGWVARGGGTPAPVAPAPMATTAPRVAPAPAVPPPLVVQPVGAPPPPAPTAVAGAVPIAPAHAPAPEVAAAKPAAAPDPEAAGEGASRSPAKRVAAKRTKTAEDEEPTTAKQVASAKPLASKPTKPTGKTGKKVWIDPFAD